MNRRIALVVSAVGLCLIACCCGGVQQPKQNQVAANIEPGKGGKAGEAPTKGTKPELERAPFVPPSPPIYPDHPKPPTPQKKVIPLLSAVVDDVKVEFTGASIGTLNFKRKTVTGSRDFQIEGKLIINVRIKNDSLRKLTYTPWHSEPKSSSAATDDIGNTYLPWHGGAATWPLGGIMQKTDLVPDKTIDDVIAFDGPAFTAQEIIVRLPGANIRKTGNLTFRIGRAFFDYEKRYRAAVAKKYEDEKRAHANLVAKMKAEHEKQVAKAKEDYDTLPMRLEQARLEEERRAAARRAEEEYEVDGLVLLRKSLNGRRGDFSGEITGTVLNRRNLKLRHVEITFNLYDESGAQVGNAFSHTSDLEVGGRWNFKAVTLNNRWTKFKCTGLSGY